MEYFAPPRPPEAEEEDDKDEAVEWRSVPEEAPPAGFYERLKLLLSPEEEEDDEESEEDGRSGKKKKRRKFLDWFKEGGVAKRSLEENAELPQETPSDGEAVRARRLSSLIDFAPDQPPSSNGESAVPSEPVEMSNPETPVAEAHLENVVDAPVSAEQDTDGTEPRGPDAEATTQEAVPAEYSDLAPRSVEADDVEPPEPPEPPVDTHPEEPPESSGAEVVVPAAGESTGNVVQNITNIENRPNNWGPAIVGSVLVDQLSRHRDRKIRRDAEAFKAKVEQQEAARDHTEDRLHKKDARLQETIERLQAKREQRQTAPAAERPVATSPDRVETRPAERPAAEQRSPMSRVEQEKIKREVLTPETKDTGAQLVMEQVEAAADKDIPVEAYYERRHEVKDEPTVAVAQNTTRGPKGGNDSAGPAHEIRAADLAQIQQSLQQRQTSSPSSASPHDHQQLKAAALIGVATAAVIVAVAIIVALIA